MWVTPRGLSSCSPQKNPLLPSPGVPALSTAGAVPAHAVPRPAEPRGTGWHTTNTSSCFQGTGTLLTQLLCNKALKLQPPCHHCPGQPNPMSWLELLGSISSWCHTKHPLPRAGAINRHKHTGFPLTRTSHTQCTFAQPLHFHFFLCFPNILTILMLSIQGKPMNFQLTILSRFERAFQVSPETPPWVQSGQGTGLRQPCTTISLWAWSHKHQHFSLKQVG